MTLSQKAPRVAPAAIREIFEAPKLSLDRSPVLFAIFERMAETLSDGMRSLFTSCCEFTLEMITMGDAIEVVSACSTGLCAEFRCPEWDASVLVAVDRVFVHAATDALFGGNGTERADVSRSISAIEMRSVGQALELIARQLGTSFETIEAITFKLERMQTKFDASMIEADSGSWVVVRFATAVQGVGGFLFIVLPQAALVPHHERLQREPAPVAGVQDPEWSRKLLAEVGRADVKLEVVMPGPVLSLQSISGLRPGQIMPLTATRDTLVGLECLGKPIYRCKLAQSEGRFAVTTEERVDEERELIGDLLTATGTDMDWP